MFKSLCIFLLEKGEFVFYLDGSDDIISSETYCFHKKKKKVEKLFIFDDNNRKQKKNL